MRNIKIEKLDIKSLYQISQIKIMIYGKKNIIYFKI